MELIFAIKPGRQYSSVVVKTLAVDFTEGQSIYPKLRSELNSLEIGVLVNCVGMIVEFGVAVGEIRNEKEIHDIINCNVMSMVRMCHIILPQMIRRKRGIILNIGSVMGAIRTPMATMYGSTKVQRCFYPFWSMHLNRYCRLLLIISRKTSPQR